MWESSRITLKIASGLLSATALMSIPPIGLATTTGLPAVANYYEYSNEGMEETGSALLNPL